MKTTIALSTPAELETEALVAVVLDFAEKETGEKGHRQIKKTRNTNLKSQLAAREYTPLLPTCLPAANSLASRLKVTCCTSPPD